MNQLLETKNLYQSGICVELYKAGLMYGVRTYKIASGVPIANFRSDKKEVAVKFYNSKTEEVKK